MKHFYLLILLLSTQFFFGQDKQVTTDFKEAKQLAAENNKDILIVMTGSQWCSTSRDMRKRVLESKDFKAYTDQNVVTYIVDISEPTCYGEGEDVQNFQKLSDEYQTEAFPAMILVNSDGEKIKEVEGKLYKRKNVLEQLNSETTNSI